MESSPSAKGRTRFDASSSHRKNGLNNRKISPYSGRARRARPFTIGGIPTPRNATIAAISTPCGEGGIGIIRISGPNALHAAERVLRLASGRKLADASPRMVHFGRAVSPDGEVLDEVLTFAFRAPHSYTREDLVEIQAHGGPVVLRRLLEAVLAAGTVLAAPGEFTERAVLNGRLNLLQAEAVLDLIRAKTNAAAGAALRRLAEDGGRRLSRVEDGMLGLLAEVEAWLDFPDDVPGPEIVSVASRAREALAEIDSILAGSERGRLLSEGAIVAIVGRPNVGKSSLLNALLGEERAIVTDIPGTTRDAVAEELDLSGMPVRLVDTAGLGRAGGELEARGMARSRREMARADLPLLVLDGSAPLAPEDEAVAAEVAGQGRGVLAINKTDLPLALTGFPEMVSSWPAVHVSARTGKGLNELREILAGELGGRQAEGAPLLSQVRQIEAAREAREALARFIDGLEQGLADDFLAEDLRGCLRALGRLTGRELGPEVLREIFSRFCLGK